MQYSPARTGQQRTNSGDSLNILQITSGVSVNGALVYCRLLSQKLADLGHKVTVLHRPGAWIAKHINDPRIELFESSLRRRPRELKRLVAMIRDRRIDLMHTHMSRAHSMGVILKLLTGTPSIATAHSSIAQIHWRMNDFVIANSEATLQFQRRVNRVPEHKLKMIHCSTNLERFDHVTKRKINIVRRQLRLTGDEFLVGIIGDIVPRKGHLHLIRALPEIVKQVPNFKLIVLGRFHRRESYVRSIRRTIIENGMFKRTRWLGLRQNIEDFVSAFDLVVVPSVEEPLGLVAIESLAGGTPVVATDVGGLPEIVRHEETGLLVPARNPQALAEAVVRMAQDRELAQRCGENGQQMVRRKFDTDRLISEVVDAYHRVLNKRAAA